jgi:hypothetical protein
MSIYAINVKYAWMCVSLMFSNGMKLIMFQLQLTLKTAKYVAFANFNVPQRLLQLFQTGVAGIILKC